MTSGEKMMEGQQWWLCTTGMDVRADSTNTAKFIENQTFEFQYD